MVSALSHDFEVQSLTCLASATLVHAAYIGSSFPLRCLSRSGWIHGMLLDLIGDGHHQNEDVLAGEQVERLNHQRKLDYFTPKSCCIFASKNWMFNYVQLCSTKKDEMFKGFQRSIRSWYILPSNQ